MNLPLTFKFRAMNLRIFSRKLLRWQQEQRILWSFLYESAHKTSAVFGSLHYINKYLYLSPVAMGKAQRAKIVRVPQTVSADYGKNDLAECHLLRWSLLNLPSEEGDTTHTNFYTTWRKKTARCFSTHMRFLRGVVLSVGQNKLFTQLHRGACVGFLLHLLHLYNSTMPPHHADNKYRSQTFHPVGSWNKRGLHEASYELYTV